MTPSTQKGVTDDAMHELPGPRSRLAGRRRTVAVRACAAALEEGAARELEVIADGGELQRPLAHQELANLKRALRQMQSEPVREEAPEELERLAELERAMAEQHEDEATMRMADCLEVAIRRHLGGCPPKYMLGRIGAACRLVEQRYRGRPRRAVSAQFRFWANWPKIQKRPDRANPPHRPGWSTWGDGA